MPLQAAGHPLDWTRCCPSSRSCTKAFTHIPSCRCRKSARRASRRKDCQL